MPDDRRVEENFRAQYEALDDDTLREIAAGDVPWAAQGVYLYGARRAARAILVERGAADVPRLPLWDPRATAMPWRWRLTLIAATLAVALGAAWVYRAAAPPDAPTDQEACSEAERMLDETDAAAHYQLGIVGCEVGPGEELREIAMRGCVTLTAPQAERLRAQPDPWLVAWLSRFDAVPASGVYCADSPRVVAQLVTRQGRPWFVRLTGP